MICKKVTHNFISTDSTNVFIESAATGKDAAVAYYTHTTIVGLTTDVYLTVGLMEAQDQGNYTCFCTNPLGSVQQTITVKG